jgi:hypothetical protein
VAHVRHSVGISLGLLCVAGIGVATDTSAQSDDERPPAMSPFVVDSLTPFLAGWIAAARDAVKAEGVEPIPESIRAALAGYVPEPTLERVRWRHGASQLVLPQSVIRFGDVQAMTLDDVIVFQDRRAALEDPKLWAHELKHVMQFAEWGIDGFAARYLRDYGAIEHEALEFRWDFMKKAGLVPKVPPPAD